MDETGFREVRICGDCGAVAEMGDSACPNCGGNFDDEEDSKEAEA